MGPSILARPKPVPEAIFLDRVGFQTGEADAVKLLEGVAAFFVADAVLDQVEQGRSHRESRVVLKALVNRPPPARPSFRAGAIG
jgi:hypothetical protein